MVAFHDRPDNSREEGIAITLRRNLWRALGSGDLTEACVLLERLREEDPLSVETRGMELDYLLRAGRLREATTLAEQLLKHFPGSPRILYLAGQAAYRVKNYRLAAEHFRESHRTYANWRSLLSLAKSLTQLGELDQAAPLFESLVSEHSVCYLDLAWLYERREDYAKALAAVEAYLKDYPNNERAKSQRLRLQARNLEPEELVRETKELLEFGEEIAEALVPQYLEALFRTGQGPQVRAFIGQRGRSLSVPLAASAGWVCYRYQAYDLAFELFTSALATNLTNAKYLSALEFAASRAGRIADLIRLYESHTDLDARLYGRLRNLRRRQSSPHNR